MEKNGSENGIERRDEPKWRMGLRAFIRYYWLKAQKYFAGITSYLIDLADWAEDLKIDVGAIASRLEKMSRAVSQNYREVCDVSNRLANVEESLTLVLRAIEKIEKHLDVDVEQADVYDLNVDFDEVKSIVEIARQNKKSDDDIREELVLKYGDEVIEEAMKEVASS